MVLDRLARAGHGMIDLTLDEVATGLHIALGALFVTFPVCWGVHHARLWGSGVCIVFAVIKEFWFDLKYEDIETSGGVSGGVLDFAGYCGGVLLANLLLLI